MVKPMKKRPEDLTATMSPVATGIFERRALLKQEVISKMTF
jgi:hypothetical protein